MEIKLLVKRSQISFETERYDAGNYLDREVMEIRRRLISVTLSGELQGFDEANLQDLFELVAPEGFITLEIKK